MLKSTLLLYGAVRSELQLSVSLSSVRHHLLEPLVRGNAHNVSVHASIDCSLPCTVASVRSAMTYYRLEPELLHVEEGTNSTDNMGALHTSNAARSTCVCKCTARGRKNGHMCADRP